MRKDGGKFRPKVTMPGIAPCVIHVEHPGESPEMRKAKVSRNYLMNRTTSFDYGIISHKATQRTATLGGLAEKLNQTVSKM